jgi:hypothetical protein
MLVALTSGCGARDSAESLSDDDAEALGNASSEAVNSAPTSLGLVAQRGFPRKPSVGERLLEAALPTAWAASCASSATLSTCADSKRTRTFDCTVGARNVTASGSIELSFSNASCLLPNSSSVTRTVDVTYTNARGGQYIVSSASHEDYRGNTIGGGQKVTVGADGSKTLEVLGMRRRLVTAGGVDLVDVSTRSIEALAVSGSALSGLAIASGKFEVIHNKAQYVTTWTPKDIAWTAGCGCPNSGSIEGELSGSKTGTLKVEFSGTCGEAKLTKPDGSSVDIDLDHCETI